MILKKLHLNYIIFMLTSLSLICSIAANKQAIVIAHRGASGYLPEHTLESKVASFMMKSDYIEQDVVLTKDSIPIVLHDLHLDEVTDVAVKYPNRVREDKRFYAIDFTLEEIKSLKVSERFHYDNKTSQYYPLRFPMWKSSFQLNTLREEIELLQGLESSFRTIYSLYNTNEAVNTHKAGLYVELKNPEFHKKEGKENFSEIVLDLLATFGYKTKQDKIFIQCFDPIELKRIRNELKSELYLVQLLESKQIINNFDWTSKQGLEEIAKFADGIGPEKSQLIVYDEETKNIEASELYKQAKKLNLLIHPYTFRIDSLPPYANNYTHLLNIFFNNLKVDGLFTDFPDLTLQYLKNNQNRIKISLNFYLFFCIIFFIKEAFYRF